MVVLQLFSWHLPLWWWWWCISTILLDSILSSSSSSVAKIQFSGRYIQHDRKATIFLRKYCVDLRTDCRERAKNGHCHHADEAGDGISRNVEERDNNTSNNTGNDYDHSTASSSSSIIRIGQQQQQKWMHSHCPVSCNVCRERILQQVPMEQSFSPVKYRYNIVYPTKNNSRTNNDDEWDDDDDDDDAMNGMIMQTAYGHDLGIPQVIVNATTVDNDNDERMIYALLEEAREYIMDEVNVEAKYNSVRDMCRNKHEQCIQWAIEGWCTIPDNGNDDDEIDEFYYEMKVLCGPMCKSCDQLHISAKCPLPHPNDALNVWDPGDLDRMFTRIATNSSYDVQVLSKPKKHHVITNEDTTVHNDDDTDDRPWLIVIDNFLNETETKRLIELGFQNGYDRSTDLSRTVLENGYYDTKISTRRTSSTAWCYTIECKTDPIVHNVLQRIETLIQIPISHYEPIQLLKYNVGQYYMIHNDYIHQDYNRMQGVRILTVFLYLNTIPLENGGGTNFPRTLGPFYKNKKKKKKKHMNNNNNSTATNDDSTNNNDDNNSYSNITVQPIVGRAVLWPSVLNKRPHHRDTRTVHQALPVVFGNKIHQGVNSNNDDDDDENMNNIIKYAANVWVHQRSIERDECL